ncbi:hypothetical protein [Massilia sp. X63]|uniref:hypothetical protein n=1 Tax=Massilia sp. X63 TaxID=3237285 RepID=UPI0034DD2AD1
MALPWLIGAAVVGLGAALAKAVSDSDSSSSSGSSSSSHDVAEERRRREAASAEQLRRERERKRADAQALFAEEGARMGASLAQALDGLAAVEAARTTAFIARLGAGGCTLPPAVPVRAAALGEALKAAFPKDAELVRIVGNLDFYTRAYDVCLQGSPELDGRLAAVEALDAEIAAWDAIAQQLSALKAGAGEAA